jgi:hypothetical protein
MKGLSWSHDGDDWVLDVCGACPVQGEGFVDGLPVYFRARGARWSFRVSEFPNADPVMVGCKATGWLAQGAYGEFPDAGWMRESHSRAIVEACIRGFRKARSGGPCEFAPDGQVPGAPDPNEALVVADEDDE